MAVRWSCHDKQESSINGDEHASVLVDAARPSSTVAAVNSCLPSWQGFAGEQYVSQVFHSAIGRPINAAMKHWRRQGWLKDEGKVFASWEAQGSNTRTDTEVLLNVMSATPCK